MCLRDLNENCLHVFPFFLELYDHFMLIIIGLFLLCFEFLMNCLRTIWGFVRAVSDV